MARHRASRVAGAAFALLLVLAPAARDACGQTVIVLTNTGGLNFGRFAARSGGTVTIGTSGARSKSGAVVLMNSPSAAQATFNVAKSKNGNVNQTVVITLPANNTVKLFSGANQMAVNNFIASPATIGSVPNGSGLPMSVGATLTVSASQPSGAYSGSFNLTVNYQ